MYSFCAVSIFDWGGVRSVLKGLRERRGCLGGAYVVVDATGLSYRMLLRLLLRAQLQPIYIGASDALAGWESRIRTLCRVLGQAPMVSDHGLVRKMRGSLRDVAEGRALAVILLPFSSGWCVETFLLEQHRRVFGVWPVGNERPGGPSSARKAHVEVTWADLLPAGRSRWPAFCLRPVSPSLFSCPASWVWRSMRSA